jgi:CheY-like chemotaxis protein
MSDKRVLVVDDDPEVRLFVETVLSDGGLLTVGAGEGAEALRHLHGAAFVLLLTDIRMPGMDGFELARRARALQPDPHVLFMSGYSAEYRFDPERDDFIAKPFRPHELLRRVDGIVNRPCC